MGNFLNGERYHLRNLAEAIILQAIEDLWNIDHRKESIEFFKGEAFRRYLGMAGMDHREKLRLLGLINGVSKKSNVMRLPGCAGDNARLRRSPCL